MAVELGGPRLPNRRRREGDKLVIVFQEASETASKFARRFTRQVANACTEGTEVTSAALLVCAEIDTARIEARCTIARTLISYFESGGDHEFILVADADDPTECHQYLTALAQVLSEGAKARCTIRV